MEESFESRECINNDFPNVYIKYRKGKNFKNKSDALAFLKNVDPAIFTLENHDQANICSKIVSYNSGEKISIFYSPPSAEKEKDLDAIKSVISICKIEHKII